jgi:hypothetical protein
VDQFAMDWESIPLEIGNDLPVFYDILYAISIASGFSQTCIYLRLRGIEFHTDRLYPGFALLFKNYFIFIHAATKIME